MKMRFITVARKKIGNHSRGRSMNSIYRTKGFSDQNPCPQSLSSELTLLPQYYLAFLMRLLSPCTIKTQRGKEACPNYHV
jgi:hypothetical protein